MAAWLLRIAGLGWSSRLAVLGVLVLGYLWLTGCSPATQRAAAMSVAVFAAGLLAREPHRLAAVSLAAGGLIVIDAGNARDIGFQLSLAAVLGIITVGLDLVRLRKAWLPLSAWPLDRPAWRVALFSGGALADGVCIGVAASLATLPLVAWHFGVINPWSPLATLAATPPTTGALWIGLPCLVVAGLFPGGPWEGLYAGLDANLAALAAVAEAAARLPGATTVVVPPSPLLLCAWPLLFLPLRHGWDAVIRLIATGLMVLIW
jgi:competence protein ComEC